MTLAEQEWAVHRGIPALMPTVRYANAVNLFLFILGIERFATFLSFGVLDGPASSHDELAKRVWRPTLFSDEQNNGSNGRSSDKETFQTTRASCCCPIRRLSICEGAEATTNETASFVSCLRRRIPATHVAGAVQQLNPCLGQTAAH